MVALLTRRSRRLAILVFSAACGLLPASVLGQTGRLSGRVVDAATNDPIRGATIRAENPQVVPDSFTAVSDDKGRFAMLGLRTGNWVLTAAAPGYTMSGGTLRVQGLTPNPPVDFKLSKAPQRSVSPFAAVNVAGVQTALTSAQTLVDRGQLDEAITAYRSLLAQVPALTMAHVQMGRAYRQKKDFDAAIAALDKVPDEDPRYVLARTEMGLTELARGNLDKAEEILTAAAGNDARSVGAAIALGEVKLARHDKPEATAWFTKASEADPSSPRPFLALGQLAAADGNTDQARTWLTKAASLDPEGPVGTEARRALESLH